MIGPTLESVFIEQCDGRLRGRKPGLGADLLSCCLLVVALPWLWGALFASAAAQGPADARAILDEAREISYTRHWSEAQQLLDELAPLLDQLHLREFVDFHLLEARHLALGDDTRAALDRGAMLLELELDVDQRLQVLQFSANIGVLLREYELAFEYLLNALALEDQLDDPVAALGTFNMATYLLGRVDETEQAIAYGERAIALALETEDPNQECVARQRLAPVFKWAALDERAEREYRTAIALCLDIGNRLFAGVLKHGLADLLRRQGRAEEARELAARSVNALTDAVFVLGEYEARLVMLEAEFDLDLIGPEHEQEFAELGRFFAERSLWDQLSRLEILMSQAAERRGDSAAALAHMRAYLEAREQFLGRDRTMRLAYLQVAFGLRIKEQQIDLLEESSRLALLEIEAASQQRRARSVILVLALGLVVLLAVLLARVFRARQHFQDLSRHDRLSGLANHGWFFERAETLLDESEKAGRPVFLVLADIDRFKRINDQYGHQLGDQALGQISRRLREAFPSDALVGRVGGEEFAILIPAREVNAVIRDVESFRKQAPKTFRSGDPQVTVSFGIAGSRAGDTLESLRRRADEALYQAKAAGRDRYIVAGTAG